MQSQYDEAAGDAVRLPAHGSTVVAEDLRIRLVMASDADGDLIVDASEVESVGQAVLQLLVAARAEAGRSGQGFSIVNASPAFEQRVRACRLAEALGLEAQEVTIQ